MTNAEYITSRWLRTCWAGGIIVQLNIPRGHVWKQRIGFSRQNILEYSGVPSDTQVGRLSLEAAGFLFFFYLEQATMHHQCGTMTKIDGLDWNREHISNIIWHTLQISITNISLRSNIKYFVFNVNFVLNCNVTIFFQSFFIL